MEHFYSYAIAQFAAGAGRDERLNLGIVVLKDDELEVRLPRSLDKLKAISAALDVDLVRRAVQQLPELDQYVREQGAIGLQDRLDELRQLASVSLSSIGQFSAPSDEQFDRCLDHLMARLVEPEPAPHREIKRRPTGLLRDVKSAFRQERVLARKGENLDAHRIVINHKIAEGLPADLILKNGAMHVVQTVDASSSEGSTRRMISSIAISALVFEQARMHYGETHTRSNLIYKATSSLEPLISPSLEAAQHQGARLVNWESRDDRVKFIVELSSLADPLADISPKASNIHASVQPKFRLN